MAKVFTSDDYDRATLGGFVGSREVNERRKRMRDDFIDEVRRRRGDAYASHFEKRTRSLDFDKLKRLSLKANKNNKTFRDDRIMELVTIEEFQDSPKKIVEYLLRDRKINKLARQHRIEAWGRDVSDIDVESSSIRFDDYYVQLNHGRPIDADDGYEYTSFLTEDEELDYFEKRTLWDNIDRFKEFLNLKTSDPSSRYDNSL